MAWEVLPRARGCLFQRLSSVRRCIAGVTHHPYTSMHVATEGGLDQSIAEEVRPLVVVPRRGPVLMAALMAIFMPAAESSVVATALPTITGDLGGFHLFSWVFAVPFLVMAVTIPLYGRLADLYGRKRVFFIGTAIFLLGTTLCGFARSMVVLIAFRALQGLGAGA